MKITFKVFSFIYLNFRVKLKYPYILNTKLYINGQNKRRWIETQILANTIRLIVNEYSQKNFIMIMLLVKIGTSN